MDSVCLTLLDTDNFSNGVRVFLYPLSKWIASHHSPRELLINWEASIKLIECRLNASYAPRPTFFFNVYDNDDCSQVGELK